MIAYTNTPGIIATLISAGLATMHELQTVYGSCDAYRMLEIHQIDRHNRGVMTNV